MLSHELGQTLVHRIDSRLALGFTRFNNLSAASPITMYCPITRPLGPHFDENLMGFDEGLM